MLKIEGIIFLDIDGVLNIMGQSYRSFYNKKEKKSIIDPIEPILVERLNFLCENFNLRIVISSSWRGNLQRVLDKLQDAGFRYSHYIIGRTPFYELNNHTKILETRGEQIMEYLKHKPKLNKVPIIVIDDEISDIVEWSFFRNAIICDVDNTEGLSNKKTMDICFELLGTLENNNLEDIIKNTKRRLTLFSGLPENKITDIIAKIPNIYKKLKNPKKFERLYFKREDATFLYNDRLYKYFEDKEDFYLQKLK